MSLRSRQLAAIMFTDIVGYTALMGKDSNKALNLVRISKEIQKPLVERHNGKWLKEMGDGAMAQFGSALDAVNCAVEIQEVARAKFDGKIRIGIHSGDITIEDNDVYGDGVNVAARLESIADPGGIYISESIEKAIRGQSKMVPKFLGELKLKNVDYDVRTYALQAHGLPVPATDKIVKLTGSETKKRKSLFSSIVYATLFFLLMIAGWRGWKNAMNIKPEEIRSLAVLPIDNFSNDQDQESLVAGLQDNLITTLSKISSLRVISKTSTKRYKDKEISMTQIASELGVDALIEASVIKFGDTVRISVQLIGSFPEEEHLWAQIFDRPAINILTLFNEVTQNIAREIDLKLTSKERALLSNAKIINPEAYQAYQKGQFYWDKLTPKDLDIALEYYQMAIDIDSTYALAHLGIAKVWSGRRQMNIVPHQRAYMEATKAIDKAFAIDSLEVQASTTSTSWMEWNWVKREAEFKKMLEMNPSNANAHAFYANFLFLFKRNDEAVFHMERALELDPFNNLIQGHYSMNLLIRRRYDEVISYVTETDQTHPFSRNALRASYFLVGDYKNAFEQEIQMASRRGDDIEMKDTLQKGYEKGGFFEAIRRQTMLLEKRSQIRFVPTMYLATQNALLEDKEKALEFLERGLVEHDANLPYISIIPLFDFLRDEPRFKEILHRMNLQE